jgi:dipeptidyl aminopeptidase/acylaminoacyl peptidase
VPRDGGTPTRIGGPCNQLRGHQVLADGRVLHVGVPGTDWLYGVVTARLFVDGEDVTGILDRTVGRETEVVSHTLEYLSNTVPPVIDDEGRVWFNVVDAACAHVYRLDDDAKPVPVITGRRLIGDFSVAAGRIAWIETSTDEVQTLRVARTDGSDEQVLLDPNPWLADRSIGEIRRVPLTLDDGTDIDAWVTLPADWDGTPLPAVVDIHPGPHSSFAWDFRLDQRLLAQAGFAVLS